MGNKSCINCRTKDKKKKDYLCNEIASPDGLPLRCCHRGTFKKLDYLKYYLDIFSKAMKKKFANRIYIDLFSGPGLCADRESGEIRDGSSLIALELANPFTHYIFVDAMPKTLDILSQRCTEILDAKKVTSKVETLNLDGNDDIDKILSKSERDNCISVAFIDPNDLGIHFSVLEKLAAIPSLDIIINFSISDLKRNLETYSDSEQNDKADKFFGCKDWPKGELEWLSFYQEKLKSLGFVAVENYSEPKVKIKTKTGADIYYLIYASKNELGLKFWRETKKKFLPKDIIPY